MKFWRDHASYPFQSHELWFLTENQRWGMMAADLDTKAIIAKVNREDLWREAAKNDRRRGDRHAGKRRRAARRRSSTARCSIPPIPRPTSPACRSRRWRDGGGRQSNARIRRRCHPGAGRHGRDRAVPAADAACPRARRAKRARHLARIVLPPLIVIAVTLFVWQLLCSEPGARLPPPTKVVADAWDFIVDPFYDNGGIDKGAFWQISKSLGRVGIGFSFAAVVGVALGVLVGQSTWAMRGLDPIFQVLRTVPPLAWLPLSLAGFRDSHPSALFVIFITSIWPIIINTSVGVRNIPQDYRNVAAVIRLSWWEVFWKITLPATVPYIFTGLRIGVGLSWLAIVAAEMLIGGVGIGFFIWDAWNSSRISDIIVALVYIGIVGFLLDKLIATVGHFVSHGVSAQ